MAPSIQSLGIDKLPSGERLDLIGAIWDSIIAEQHPPLVNDKQASELKHRAAQDDAEPDDVVAWEQAKSRTLDRLRA